MALVEVGQLYHALQAYGLTTTSGTCPSVGVAGLTLGGGVGKLMCKYGLACDNVLSAQIVTADGRVLTASREENSDLFWAIRGGGGNFAVFRIQSLRPRSRSDGLGRLSAFSVLRCAATVSRVCRFGPERTWHQRRFFSVSGQTLHNLVLLRGRSCRRRTSGQTAEQLWTAA